MYEQVPVSYLFWTLENADWLLEDITGDSVLLYEYVWYLLILICMIPIDMNMYDTYWYEYESTIPIDMFIRVLSYKYQSA